MTNPPSGPEDSSTNNPDASYSWVNYPQAPAPENVPTAYQQPYPPAYPPGQVPPPGYPPQWAPPRPTNGMAIASMVLGILWLYWVGSILALVFGYVARSQIRERNEAGDGMAIAGIVLGWVGIGVLAVGLIIGAISLIVAGSSV